MDLFPERQNLKVKMMTWANAWINTRRCSKENEKMVGISCKTKRTKFVQPYYHGLILSDINYKRMSHIRELHTSKDEFVSNEKWPNGHTCKIITREMTNISFMQIQIIEHWKKDQRSALHWIRQGGTHPKQGIVHKLNIVKLDLIPSRIMNRRGRGMRMDFSVYHMNYLQAAGVWKALGANQT